MKRFLLVLSMILIGAITASALDPIRISVVTDVNTTTPHSVTVDILNSAGASIGIATNTVTGQVTDASGVLSFVLQGGSWAGLDYATSKNYNVHITYNGKLVGNARLEDLLRTQGLFGAVINPNEMQIDGAYTLGSIAITNPSTFAGSVSEALPVGDGDWAITNAGKANFQDLSITRVAGTADFAGTLQQTGATPSWSILNTGAATFNGNVTLGDAVTDVATVNGEIGGGSGGTAWYISRNGSGAGKASFQDLHIMDAAKTSILEGTLAQAAVTPTWSITPAGKVNVQDFSMTKVTGVADFAGTLQQTGATPTWAITNAGAESLASNLSVGGTSNLVGTVTVGTGLVNSIGTIVADGPTNNGYILINDQLTVEGTLIMHGASNLLSVEGTANVNGNTTLKGNVTLGDGIGTDLITFPAGVHTVGSIIPNVTNTNDLGASGNVWANVYATTFHGAMGADLTFGNGIATYNAIYNGSTARTISVKLNGTTLLNDGTGAGISLNLGNANTWTATQTFNTAATSLDVWGNIVNTSGTNPVTVNDDMKVTGGFEVSPGLFVVTAGNGNTYVAGLLTVGVESASPVAGKIILQDAVDNGTVGPTGALTGTLQTAAALSANQTWTFPDVTGTVVIDATPGDGYTLQDAYTAGNTINGANAVDITGPGLDVHSASTYHDAITAELTNNDTPATQQATIIGTLTGATNYYGILGGHNAIGTAGVIGSVTTSGPAGMLGATVGGHPYAGFFAGDVNIANAGDFNMYDATSPTPLNVFSVDGATGNLYARGYMVMEGTTDDANDLTINCINPTAPQTINFPNASGTILLDNTVNGFAWRLLGNSGTTAGTNFIGTTDNQDLVFKRNSIEAGRIGASNTSFGLYALTSNSGGLYNTAIGVNALNSNVTGTDNVAIGDQALRANTASFNVGIGNMALGNNTTGNYNIAIGYDAGNRDAVPSNNTTSSNSIYIGTNSSPLVNGDANEIVIGYNTNGHGSNTVTLGNPSITATYLQGAVTATSYNGFTLPAGSASAAGNILVSNGADKTLNWSTIASAMADLTAGAGLKYTVNTTYDGSAVSTIAVDFDNSLQMDVAGDGGLLGINLAHANSWTGVQTFTGTAGPIVLDGTVGGFATTLAVVDPTAANTITFPNASGTIMLTGSSAGGDLSGTYPNPTIASGAGNDVVAALNDVATTSKVSPTKLGFGLADEVLLTNVTPNAAVWGKIADANISATAAIANSKLANSSITIGSTSIALGTTASTLAGLTSVDATTFNGALSGNATTATTATNLAGGAANQLAYQTAAGATNFITAGTDAMILGNVSGLPTWVAMSGDVTINNAGATTIGALKVTDGMLAGSISNGKLANSAVTVTAGTGLSGGGSVSLGSSTTLNLANTTVTANPYGSATKVPTFTVDAQGRLTAAADVTIQIAESQVTSLTTDLGNKQPLNSNLTTIAGLAVTDKNIMVADGSGWKSVAMSGDVTIDNTGATAIGLLKVTDGMLAGSISNGKLANSAVTVTAGTGLSGGGSVSLGSSTTLNLANTTVTANPYGSATAVPTFTVDAQGRLTAAADVTIQIAESQVTSLTTDLGNKQPLNSNLTTIAGLAVTDKNIMVANGSAWTSVGMSGDVTISNTGVTVVADDSHNHTTATAGFAVTGGNLTVGTVGTPYFSVDNSNGYISNPTINPVTINDGLTVVNNTTLQGKLNLSYETIASLAVLQPATATVINFTSAETIPTTYGGSSQLRNGTDGEVIYIINGHATNALSVGGKSLAPGQMMTMVWGNSTWHPIFY